MNVFCQFRLTGARWLGALGVCLLPFAIALAAPPATFNLTETVLKEPIFRGTAHVVTAGPEDAPTVVLVHGIGDRAARDWEGLIAVLARSHRVVAFDLPGFGRSSKGNESYTPENYVAFLRYLMTEHIHAQSFSLIGHSMGGAIALRYAARYPQDVTALVLVDVPGILHRLSYSKSLSHLGINSLPSLYRAQNDHLRNLMSNILGVVEKIQPAPRLSSPIQNGVRVCSMPSQPRSPDWHWRWKISVTTFRACRHRCWCCGAGATPSRRCVPAGYCPQTCRMPNSRCSKQADTRPWTTCRRASTRASWRSWTSPVLERRNGILSASCYGRFRPGSGTCKGQRGVVFEGDYDRISIYRCRDALVRNARVRELRITDACGEYRRQPDRRSGWRAARRQLAREHHQQPDRSTHRYYRRGVAPRYRR